jgi:MerR family copper efflux transcriptional regulator
LIFHTITDLQLGEDHDRRRQMNGFTIGKVAKRAGIDMETIRIYEREGLIEAPPRTESGYRKYPGESVARLHFIKRVEELGFSLDEIKELLFLRQDEHATKADIKKRTLEKIEDVKRQRKELTRVLRALEHLASTCDGHGPVSDCPILGALVLDALVLDSLDPQADDLRNGSGLRPSSDA